MSTNNTSNFNRESICVTCLSPDRKLFSLSASEVCAEFYFELSRLSLGWRDKICWECYYMVKKMVAFKSRAQAAQAWLQNATKKHHEAQCLSTLSISTGMCLNIIDPDSTTESTTPDPLSIVNIKEEMLFVESIDNVIEIVYKKEDDGSSDAVEVKAERIEDQEERRKEAVRATSNIVSDFPILTDLNEPPCIPQFYGELECNICHQRALNDKTLEFHIRQHYRLLQCLHCEFSWDNVNTMLQHCNDVHQIKQTLWECDECGRQFTSHINFWYHIRQHRAIKFPVPLKKRRSVEKNNPKVQCKECGKCYPRNKFKAHMRRHNTVVDPAAYCEECGKQFRDILLYKEHMTRKMHTDESLLRFQCDKCSKKFRTKLEVQRHLVVHEENRTVYPCEQCGQSFIQQGSLLRHKQKKHEGKELPRVPRNKLCDYCGKAFLNKYFLGQHLNSHTGVRPYVCRLCGAAYRYESALYRHRRYKHKIQKKNPNKTRANKSSKTIEDKEAKKNRGGCS